MAYRIRYGPGRWRVRRQGSVLRFQAAVAAGMLAAVLGISALFPGGRQTLADLLTARELSRKEQALAVYAQAVAAGEGWYDGAVAWCRALLEMA